MATLGSLIISLEANTAKFESAMSKAQYQAKKSSDAIKSSLLIIGGTLITAFSISKIESWVTGIAAAQSAMLKMAERLNTNVETLNSFGIAIRKTGMDTDSFYMALTRLEKGMSAAAMKSEEVTGKFDEEGEEIHKTAGAYDLLGLKAEVLLKLPLAQQLMEIAAAFKDNIDPADRVNIAMQLFGKSGAGMVNILKGGAEELRKWIAEQENLDTITTESAKKSAEFMNATKNLKTSWEEFQETIAESVIPTLNALLERLNAGIKAAAETDRVIGLLEKGFGEEAARKYAAKRGSIHREAPFGEAAETFYGILPYEPAPGVRKPPTRPGDELKLGGAGGKGSAADDISKELDKVKREVESARREAQAGEIEAWNMIFNIKKSNAEMYLEAEKNQYSAMELQRSLYSNLAAVTPILEEQNLFKRKALDLEIEIERYTLNTKLLELEKKDIISKAQADELRGLQALEAQAKKYSLAMEQDKGLTGWAFGRTKEVGQKNTIRELMNTAENSLQNAFSAGLQGVLSQDKKTLENIGKTMFMGFVGELHKGALTRSFDALAKMLSPAKEGQDPAKGLTLAGMKLDSAGAQLATSAGGLLLSGIGIATNSQALVIAGSVLQVAGLAIQIYQSLVATTQITAATALTTSAGALTASAAALTAAAGSLAAGSGTSGVGGILGFIGGLFFHQGGPIYAHAGWPLRSDEVPIIAQRGERVLSRAQNQIYEAGGGGVPIAITFNHAPTYNYRPTQRDMDRDADMMVRAINRKLGARGKSLG